MAYLSFIFLFAVAATAYGSTPPDFTTVEMFDCRRPGQTCVNRDCKKTSGTGQYTTCEACAASNTETGLQECIADTSLFAAAPNANPPTAAGECTALPAKCLNGGTCIKLTSNNNEEKCFCTKEYTGDTCQTSRVQIDCATDTTKMKMIIVPLQTEGATFSGKIYARGHSGTTTCNFQPGTPTTSYELELIKANNPCGHVESTPANEGKKSVLNVVVQYNQHYLSSADQNLELSCTQPATGEITTSVVQVQSNTAIGAGIVEQKRFPVTFAVENSNGVVSSPVIIGADLKLKFTLTPGATFAAMFIHSCKATNGIDSNELVLVDGTGCPGTDRSVIPFDGKHVSGNPAATDNIAIPFKAFMFLKGSESTDGSLFISCSVRLCPSSSKDQTYANGGCTQPTSTCTPTLDDAATAFGPNMHGRKKRSILPGTEEEVMGQMITVSLRNVNVTFPRNNGASNAGAGAQGSMDKANECLQNPQMQTVLAVLGLLLVLAVVALTATAVLYCRGRGNQDSRLKYVDNYATGSSTQTLAMPKI